MFASLAHVYDKDLHLFFTLQTLAHYGVIRPARAGSRSVGPTGGGALEGKLAPRVPQAWAPQTAVP